MSVAEKLTWWPQKHMGYYPVTQNGKYGREYWECYVRYKASPIAEQLVAFRIGLTDKYCKGATVVDIGIGSGHFIERRHGKTFGYDANPLGIRWLLDRDLWWDPFIKDPENVTCWDSLEHMARPDLFIDRVRNLVFVSIPMFRDKEHAMASKHFKPEEHYWYWTREGFISWMTNLGFYMLEERHEETQLGREDIGTFAFKRIEN